MPSTDEPHDREELLAAFETVHREASELFGSFSDEDFFRHPGDGAWSVAENVVHLIKSVQAVASAMRIPKPVLTVLFGGSRGGSRSYSEVRARCSSSPTTTTRTTSGSWSAGSSLQLDRRRSW